MEEEKPRTPSGKDSSLATLRHIKRVNELLINASIQLLQRAKTHDASKLESPEKEYFDLLTTHSEYGSAEYGEDLKILGSALDHHYKSNSHHPEHYEFGVDGMNLFDLIEMFFDWKAASEQHEAGNIFNSLTINKSRFGLSDQVFNILRNTAKDMNFDPPPPKSQ